MGIKMNCRGKYILSLTQFSTRIRRGFTRPMGSSSQNRSKNITDDNKSTSMNDGASSSLRTYDEQYKALQSLDFMTAAKIVFMGPPKQKKFGLDFHLVQLFFVCLPSLAVYLVAQYARSEMRKMDAELELRKKAELEAQAKELEHKAAEEKAAAESNPAILEVKERLQKLEETVKEIASESKKRTSEPTSTSTEDHKDREEASIAKPNTLASSKEQSSGFAPATGSDASKND